jgi:hypothetical protein
MVRLQAEVAEVCRSGGSPCQMNFAQQRDIGSEVAWKALRELAASPQCCWRGAIVALTAKP